MLKIQDQYELTEVGIDSGCAYTCKNGTLEIVFPDDLFGELGYQPPSRDWFHELNAAMTKIVHSLGS